MRPDRNTPGVGEGYFVPPGLRRLAHLPLWYQVTASLRAAILGRPPEAPLRLPTEEALARHYGVGVLTMRRALGELEGEGLLTRRRRHGTHITPGAPAAARTVQVLGSVDAIVAQQSGDPVTLLGHGPTAVPAEYAEHFPAGSPVHRYERLRHDAGSGEPVNLAVNWLPPALASRVDPADLARGWPMTRVLRDRAGVRIARITDTLRAGSAGAELARVLDVPQGSPVLHYTGVTRDPAGDVVDVVRIDYRGDRFTFSLTLDAVG